MEYIDGMPLDEYLKTSPSHKERLRILNELLDALTFIHSHQVIHNDLKPSNILITKNGHNVKLIDFGCADCDANIDKAIGGTIAFAPPEQISREVSAPTNDIHSLGTIIKTMFPRQYGAIARKCMRERSRRYQRIEEVRNAFRRSLWRKRMAWGALACAGLAAIVALTIPLLKNDAPQTSPQIEPASSAPASESTANPSVVTDAPANASSAPAKQNTVSQPVITAASASASNTTLNFDSIHQVYKSVYNTYKKALEDGIADGSIVYKEFAAFYHYDCCDELNLKYYEMQPDPEDDEAQRMFEADFQIEYSRYYKGISAIVNTLPSYYNTITDEELKEKLEKEYHIKQEEHRLKSLEYLERKNKLKK